MDTATSKALPVVRLSASQDTNDFVKSWSRLYNYAGYDEYKTTVRKSELSKKDLRLLFAWKNGSDISTKKDRSFLSQLLQHQELLNELKKEFDQKTFEKNFGKMSAVLQIFLLHILQPSEYPVFDKYVYRAFRFIQNKEEKRLPSDQAKRLKIFENEYRPFFLDFCMSANAYDHFDVDKALWTFGKAIREYPGLVRNVI